MCLRLPYDWELQGDVTRGNLQRRFLAQRSVTMLEQCCNHSKQYCNNVTTLYCAKNRRCELSRVTSPLTTRTATVAKTSLLNWIRAFPNFVPFSPIFPENVKCRPVFLDLNFWGPYPSLKREKNSPWLVCVLHKGDVTRDDSQQRF